jgi:ribose transport system substrate-binding protein
MIEANMRAFLLTLSLIAMIGCQKQGLPVVGVIPKGASHQFWLTVQAGAIQAGREYGLEIEWNAPALEIDRARQIDIVQSMVTRKLAGIAIAPVDRKALVSVIDRASAAQIPVVVYDSDVDTNNRILYVATDNREAGRMAARRLGEVLQGKGKVLIVGFMPGSASTMEREEGFIEEMKKSFPGVQVLDMQFGMASRAKAMSVTENTLSAHGDLAGVFADNESSLAGAVQALKSRNNRVAKLVGIDASEQLIQDLREGWIESLVVQDPFRMGYESVKAIGEFRKGVKVNARLDLPAKLILAGDLGKPEVQDLLFPKLEKWLKTGTQH